MDLKQINMKTTIYDEFPVDENFTFELNPELNYRKFYNLISPLQNTLFLTNFYKKSFNIHTIKIENAEGLLLFLTEKFNLPSERIIRFNILAPKNEYPVLRYYFIILSNDCYLYFQNGYYGLLNIIFASNVNSKKIENLIETIQKNEKPVDQKNIFHFMTYDKVLIKYKDPHNTLPIEYTCNDDVIEFINKLKTIGASSQQNGIILLTGVSGTGKTSFIRYLTTQLKSTFIIINPICNVLNYEYAYFAQFELEGFKNCLFIAENIEEYKSVDVDGIVGPVKDLVYKQNTEDDILIPILATINEDMPELDPSLYKSGKLLAHYNFTKINAEKANKLSEHLGKAIRFSEPVVVGDVFESE